MAERLPDVSKIKRGTLTVDYGGARWSVACALHAEPPMHHYAHHALEEGMVAVLRDGDFVAVPLDDVGALEHALNVMPLADDDGLYPVLRFPAGVVRVKAADITLEDAVLAGEPIRKANGEPHWTGDPAPGYQPDCLSCEETAENAIDHIVRVGHDRETAARMHARESRRIRRELGLNGGDA